eukprot:1186742-Prorocentrum_minimum.AAC.9
MFQQINATVRQRRISFLGPSWSCIWDRRGLSSLPDQETPHSRPIAPSPLTSPPNIDWEGMKA